MARFLAAASHPAIQGALAPVGFDPDTLEEGWTLLRQVVCGPRPEDRGAERDDASHAAAAADAAGPAAAAAAAAAASPAPAPADRTMAALHAWHARWPAVARVVLRRHHPEVERALFANLPRGRGASVVIVLSVWLDRLDALLDHAAEGPAVRGILARHGLDEAVLAQGRRLLASVQRLPPVPARDPRQEREEHARQVDAMWRYCVQWNGLARIAIQDPQMLDLLGLGASAARRQDRRQRPAAEMVPGRLI